MTETLPEKVITLDKNKIDLPPGLELKKDPEATLAAEKVGDIYHITLSSQELGLRTNLCLGGINKDDALAQFQLNLKVLEHGKYEISCNLSLRTLSYKSIREE